MSYGKLPDGSVMDGDMVFQERSQMDDIEARRSAHYARAASLMNHDLGKAEAVIRDLQSRLQEFEWQTIETAPKDTREVDLWGPRIGRCTDFQFIDGVNPFWLKSGGGIVEVREATHWMPKPKPPKTPEEIEERWEDWGDDSGEETGDD